MESNKTLLLSQAQTLLDARQPDKAIEVLRSKEAPADAEICALLAECYYQRGDTKGDVYSSNFFAERALELGASSHRLFAVCAVAAFRKEFFAEAVNWFQKFVSEKSAPDLQFLYGLALAYSGDAAGGEVWCQKAAAEESQRQIFQDGLQEISERCKLQPAARSWMQAENRLGGLLSKRPKEIPCSSSMSPLSKLCGNAFTAKDIDWLKKNIPCQSACPAGTDIPAYLRAIYEEDYQKAYRINLEDNVFPGVLGRVCARPCEAACRHGWDGLGESVAICFSTRAAADLREQKPVDLAPWFAPSGKQVAVVGAGVAGLAAARNLALMGHSVTVFERHHQPGGMMNQGIPEFRLPREVIDCEIEQVKMQGVKIICNFALGRDGSLKQLLEDFDAIVLAAGTLRPNLLKLPGAELQGIHHGLDFLLQANLKRDAEIGKKVVVIGGGFTAMDCARTAARIGAKAVELETEGQKTSGPITLEQKSVKVLYRRSQDEMLITPGELEELEQEDIPMHFMVSPIAYQGADGKIKSMKFIRTKLGEPDASGRKRPVEIPGSEFELAADTVLLATGQFPDTSWIDQELYSELVGPDKWLKSGEATKTSHPQIFAAGDYATGASSLINAIGHAKRCALDVDEFLTGKRRMRAAALIEDAEATGRIREMDFVARQQMAMLPKEERSLTAEVERGYDAKSAQDETQRCYLCHYKFEIDPDSCIYCDWCIKAKPRPECIVKVSALSYDAKGRIVGYHKAKGSEDTKQIWINQADCIRCNACVDACPVDAISIQKVSLCMMQQP